MQIGISTTTLIPNYALGNAIFA